ncbi:hypothetical protein A4A49_04105 [Nicotiana attenuata]|uniref:Uncharacterized protein n=1 Tax=Nicotiana attenuata TaxID=49451 RepID=A0A314L8G7_NICAT|nr:hypothetical protein A4A49_04105 [Nicotiana attenuata]
MPPRKDTGKGKATSMDQAKEKPTSAPPPKKRKGGEATSSMTGTQAVAGVAAMRQQPPSQWEFGINSIPPHTRDWYKRCRPKHIHPEGAIQERSVKAKYPAILERHPGFGHERVEEEPEFDHTIDQLIRQTDITNLRLKDEAGTPSLTGAERNARDDSFMAHLYGMMDLQLRIGGRPATSEERTELEQRYPLNAHAQQLVGVGEEYILLADEDVNTPEQS